MLLTSFGARKEGAESARERERERRHRRYKRRDESDEAGRRRASEPRRGRDFYEYSSSSDDDIHHRHEGRGERSSRQPTRRAVDSKSKIGEKTPTVRVTLKDSHSAAMDRKEHRGKGTSEDKRKKYSTSRKESSTGNAPSRRRQASKDRGRKEEHGVPKSRRREPRRGSYEVLEPAQTPRVSPSTSAPLRVIPERPPQLPVVPTHESRVHGSANRNLARSYSRRYSSSEESSASDDDGERQEEKNIPEGNQAKETIASSSSSSSDVDSDREGTPQGQRGPDGDRVLGEHVNEAEINNNLQDSSADQATEESPVRADVIASQPQEPVDPEEHQSSPQSLESPEGNRSSVAEQSSNRTSRSTVRKAAGQRRASR
ncbi:hypothetical protein K402DRAFT_158622 [Aulographum hederae CBS 113979]|uniref:Uncharacterized protein n=1 Tax=Aulographum hederae CBS 113979 TaxID=1176131 RepID=A0A6G1GRP6_9PEZI|nr:hypothetical protein K402DRAFT_158622 [Aulographum hederae CBS 113979]